MSLSYSLKPFTSLLLNRDDIPALRPPPFNMIVSSASIGFLSFVLLAVIQFVLNVFQSLLNNANACLLLSIDDCIVLNI